MMKKVLYFEGNMDGTIGGTYYYMYDLVNSLDKNRYEPIAGFHWDNIFVERFAENNVKVIIAKYPTPFTFGSALLDKYLFWIKKLNNLFQMLLLPAIRYAQIIKSNNIEIVHLSNSISGNHIWMLACLMTNTKCMTHETGFIGRYSRTSRFFAKRMHSIICVSNSILNNMKSLGLNYPNMKVVYNGLDGNRCRINDAAEVIKEKYGIADSEPVIGVVGNIREWKGQETIVRATAILKKKYTNIRCFIVGDATPADYSYLERLKSIIKEEKIDENIIFTGFQKNPLDYINIMDIFVHTSIRPEPFGIVILEAMYLKKPIISTIIGGPAEIIQNGVSGILIKPNEPELLAESVDNLLRNKILAQKYGDEGYIRLNNEFTMKKNAESVMRIYDQAFVTN